MSAFELRYIPIVSSTGSVIYDWVLRHPLDAFIGLLIIGLLLLMISGPICISIDSVAKQIWYGNRVNAAIALAEHCTEQQKGKALKFLEEAASLEK